MGHVCLLSRIPEVAIYNYHHTSHRGLHNFRNYYSANKKTPETNSFSKYSS